VLYPATQGVHIIPQYMYLISLSASILLVPLLIPSFTTTGVHIPTPKVEENVSVGLLSIPMTIRTMMPIQPNWETTTIVATLDPME